MKKNILQFWRNPLRRYGSMSTLLLVLALAALIAINGLFTTLEDRNGWRLDRSFNRIATYSDATEEVLANLDTPVVIYDLHERGYEDYQLIELLDRYCAASDLVTWEARPLSLNTELASILKEAGDEDNVTAQSLIVLCPETSRYRLLVDTNLTAQTVNTQTWQIEVTHVTYENALTSAIAYVSQETSPVVYVVQGHRERTYADATQLNTLLLENHYDVRYGELSQIALTPDDLVVFLAPRSDLTEGEMAQMIEFIEAGGRILFTASGTHPINGAAELPQGMPNYRELLRLYGFIPLTNTVWASVSEPETYDGRIRKNLYAALETTEITLPMTISSATQPRLYMPDSCAFQTPEEAVSGLQAAPLLTSGEKAYLHTPTSGNLSIAQSPDDPTGPFTLGLEAYRFSATGEISRAVVLGSTDMLLDETAHSNAFNREFILRTLDYLVDSNTADMNITPKIAFRPVLSADAIPVGSMLLVFLPLSVLTAAFLILFPRRHL